MSGMSGSGIDVGHRRQGKSRLARMAAAMGATIATTVGTITGRFKSFIEEIVATKEPNRQRDLRRTRTGQLVEVNKRTGGRPAETYHANGGGTKLRVDQTRRVLDRATDRSYWRSRERRNAGRWPGIGDPGAVVSYRKQMMTEALRTGDAVAKRTPGGAIKRQFSRIVNLGTS